MNGNETKAMRAICADCDELDGWGFTRPSDMVAALLKAFRRTETWWTKAARNALLRHLEAFWRIFAPWVDKLFIWTISAA